MKAQEMLTTIAAWILAIGAVWVGIAGYFWSAAILAVLSAAFFWIRLRRR